MAAVTAGNASAINDGAAALLLASEAAIQAHGLIPKARVIASAAAGVLPRVMGMGPVAAVNKLLAKTRMLLDQMDVIELNEAFAAQAVAVLRALGLPDDAPQVNPNGGAIALGASGTRLVMTAVHHLHRTGGRPWTQPQMKSPLWCNGLSAAKASMRTPESAVLQVRRVRM